MMTKKTGEYVEVVEAALLTLQMEERHKPLAEIALKALRVLALMKGDRLPVEQSIAAAKGAE